MTVSKMPFRIPESMRWPDASTTSDATETPPGNCRRASLRECLEATLNGLPERRLHRLGTDEEVGGETSVREHLVVDGAALIQVEAEPGEVLEPQVAIA